MTEEEKVIYSKALDLLARREESRFTMQQKLYKREYNPELIEAILEKLENKGYLSDRRFAEEWVRTRLVSRFEGPPFLVASLKQKGIEDSLARDVVEAAVKEVGYDQLLLKALQKALKKSNITQDKVVSTLLRKGFSYGRIKAVIKEEGSWD